MAIGGVPAVYPPSSTHDELEMMTIDEVAAVLKVDRSTVSRLILRGEMKAAHFGRSVRVMKRDLVEFIEQSRGW
jgi:excisionase family DNA binding protein